MLPDWYVRMSAATGPAFVPAWTNADVVAVSLIAFAIFFVLATLMAADWPSDIAVLSLVAGGLLVVWPAMIALTMAAVLLAIVVSVLHSTLAPGRTARIAAEAQRQVAPMLDRFARDVGLNDAERRKVLADSEAERRAP